MNITKRYAKQYPLQFTGSSGEYFRIWITNISLSLLTLGIYSAWAKVRTKNWFYGHTLLDNQAFGYHATPMQLLKARLIAVAFFIIYTLSAKFSPTILAPVMLLILLLAMPWIIVSSLKFNARNTSYRGIRFRFIGSVGEAFKYYLLYPFLSIFTLGIAMPYVVYLQKQFLVNHYHYGQTAAQFNATVKPFWKIYGVMMLLFLIPVVFLLTSVNFASFDPTILKSTVMIGSLMSFYLLLPFAIAYVSSRMTNLVYNESTIGTVAFTSTLRARDLIWLYISNLLLIMMTFGLLIPFVKVRMVKYHTRQLSILSADTLENFSGTVNSEMNAIGSEMAEVFDLDFSLS